jgi:hypothetical protein
MKKQMTRLMAAVMGGLFVTMSLVPSVRAGDQEWATAGKVLTGLAVFGALSSWARPDPYYYEQRTVYVDRPVYISSPPVVYAPPQQVYAPQPQVYAPQPQAYAPQPQVYAPQPQAYAPQPQAYAPQSYAPPPVPVQETPVVQPVYVQTPMVVYETRYFEGRRMERCPRVSFRDRRYAPSEIVVPYGQGLRLYQPGIRGHVTYVQQWSSNQGVWLTVGRHPCMW